MRQPHGVRLLILNLDVISASVRPCSAKQEASTGYRSGRHPERFWLTPFDPTPTLSSRRRRIGPPSLPASQRIDQREAEPPQWRSGQLVLR
jgi:hypothetical protein